MHSICDMVKLFQTNVINIEICNDMNVNMVAFYRNNASIININRNRYKLKTDTRLD